MEHSNQKVLFVDELKFVLETMGKKKPDKTYSVPYDHQNAYHHFMYMSEDYLDYALSLFGSTRDDVQVIQRITTQSEDSFSSSSTTLSAISSPRSTSQLSDRHVQMFF